MSFWGYYIPPKAWLRKQPRKGNGLGANLTDENYDLTQLSDIVYDFTFLRDCTFFVPC